MTLSHHYALAMQSLETWSMSVWVAPRIVSFVSAINDMSFTSNGSTITDNNTGLTWQTEDDGTTRTWDQAGS